MITKGFSGNFGEDLMFRQLDNRTLFVKRTLVTAVPSVSQAEVRSKFAQAAQFAAAAIENPQASLEYKLMAEMQGLKSAYLAAVTDYLTKPEIGSVYAGSYRGVVGDVFNIKTKVPYKIIDIQVSIVLADGTVVESGAAVANELKWKYTATAANAQVAGSKLLLVAHDRQGKEVTFEQAL